ncbi:MAG: dolichyl-phosphate beta-glucosyltransferase [Candidatus Goldiibacteriota bacterium]
MAQVSIIIPAYNEEKRLPATLQKISAFIKKKKLKAEIIVVDDGSTDNTSGAALAFKGAKIRVIKNPGNMGKGYSVKNGAMGASGDIILFTDADLSTPIKHLEEFIAFHKKGYDVVIASRDLVESKVMVPQSHLREFGGKFFNLMVRVVTGLMVHDTQCGFKSFTKKAAGIIFPRQTIFNFGFDVELLYIASRRGLSIKESAVEWYNDSATKVKFLRDSVKMFAELFIIRFNGAGGRYN